MIRVKLQVAAEAASRATAEAVALAVPEVAAAAPEEMVGTALLVSAGVEEVGLSSMVQTVPTRVVVADTFAVGQAVKIMAMMPLAPAAEEVVVESSVTVSCRLSMEAMQPMVPTVAVAVAAALAHPTQTVATMRAAVEATADLVAAVEVQEPSARSLVAVMEEMEDLVAAPASASAPTSICTANQETEAVSEEAVMAVAVAAEAELLEAPSS